MFPELEFQDVIILVAGNNFHLNIIPKKSAVKKHPVRSFARGPSILMAMFIVLFGRHRFLCLMFGFVGYFY